MKRLRVVFPCYGMRDDFTWLRKKNVLRPLSEVVDLTVYHFDDVESPQDDFCSFVKVPTPTNLKNLAATEKDALLINMELPDYDLLYCWSGGAYFQLLSVLTAQVAGKPIVMHINGDAFLARKHNCLPQEKLLEDAIDCITLNNLDLAVPISRNLHEAMRDRVKQAGVLCDPVPFTVDVEDFSPQHFPRQVTVGYGGRVSREKGFPFYFDVIRQTKAKFRIAGPIQMKGVVFADNCHYDGLLDLAYMPRFYGLCSVLALPSFGEGMPGTVLEAYASGRPVIVSPEALPPELPCFGWVVERDVSAWKRTIEGLSQAEIEQKGAAAREWVTKNWPSWRDFAVTMREKFEGVVG